MINMKSHINLRRVMSFLLSLCMITSIGSSAVTDAASVRSGDSSSSVVDVKPAKEYPDVERHTVAEMLADGCDEIYVPSAPSDVPNAQSAKTIADALAKLTDGGVIWLTADASIDTVNLMNNVTVAISSHGSTAYTVTKSGESENMLTLSDKSELTLENVVIDATENKNGRTISVSGGSVLTLGKGAVLENNISYGAVYSDGSSVCVDGGAIRNNTAAGEAGTKEYQPSGTWTAVSTKYVFNADMGSKQALGGAILMVNESAFEMTSGELGRNTAATGGAIYAWASGNIKLYGGTVSENKAESSAENIPAAGGAICVDGGAEFNVISEVIVNGAVFSQNRAKQGGAIYLGIDAGTVDFIMTGGKFIGNSSTGDGSVIYSIAADGVMNIGGKSTVFAGNNSASNGAIYQGMYPGNQKSDRAKIYIHDGASFAGNYANKGSCFYATRDGGIKALILDSTSFTDNETKNDAGVMQYNVPNSDVIIRNSVFKNNQAGNRGGCFYFAVDSKGMTATISGSTFEKNSAKGDGGVLRAFPPESKLIFKDSVFKKNTSGGSGGVFYFPADGQDAEIEIDGSEFIGNTAEIVGGTFRAGLKNSVVTIKGASIFSENTAKVNAGAFAVYRKEQGIGGTVNLLEAEIKNNHCYADFSNYSAKDLVPTQHYNTGGVYIGEDVVLKTYDIEITQNQVKSGYEGNMIGTGIGVCPHGTVILNPEHGAKIHNNGDGNGMDILAVPWDEVIDHEVPSQLYIPEKTPDGKDYNWTDLNGDEARTGLYSWNEVLKEKEDAEQGISTVSLMAESNGYTGEKSLDPVGFRANIEEPRFKTMAANSTTEPKVYIAGNSSDSALYGGGGMMVNGTVIAGDLEVSVEKKTEGLSEEDKKTKEFEFEFSITYKSSYSTEENAMKSGFNTEGDVEIDFKKTGGEITGEETGKITLKKSATEESGVFYPTLSCTFKLKSDEKITFSNFKDNGYSIFYNGSYSENPYYFELKEIDSGGAESVEITKKVADTEVTGDIFDPDHNYSTGTVHKIEFTCTNTFKGSLTVTKVLEGDYASAKNKTFTFTVTGPSYPNGEKVEITGANSETLNNLLPGKYTVVEESAEIKGYKLKTKMNPENGVVDVTGGNEVTVTVTNTYNVEPTEYAPQVNKTVRGNAPSDETFTFNIKASADNPDGAVLPTDTTATVKGAGTASFGSITFSKVGTYKFEISETKGESLGCTYDESVWTLTVKVENVDSALAVTSHTYTKEGVQPNENNASFENIYFRPVTFTPKAIKTLIGAIPSSEGTFSFSIKEKADNPENGAVLPEDATATVTGEGTARFGAITFTKAGEYKFEIREIKGDEAGYTYDESVWTLTVEVADNDSQLEVESYSYTKAGGITNEDGAAFTNRYNVTKAEYTPKVTKTISGVAPANNKSFTFSITAKPNNPSGVKLPENTSATITGAGSTNFNAITFSKAGTYNFEIKETKGNDEGYTYDESVWTLTVVVTDEDSQLKVSSATYSKIGAQSAAEATFTNIYTVKSTEYQPKVKKTVTGDPSSDKTFTFSITAKADNPNGANLPTNTEAKVTGTGTASFGNIIFTKAGTYNFEIKEEQGNEPGYSYDGSIWTLTVEVTDEDSQLKVSSAEYSKAGAKSTENAEFENSYSTTEVSYAPQVEKTVTGDTPSDKEFTFNIEASEDNPSGAEMPTDKTATVTGAGSANFGDITFTKAGTYTFKMSEAKGNDAGYTYDESVWTLKVVVEDTDSVLTVKSHTYTKDDGTSSEERALFTNTYSAEPTEYAPQVEKTVTGDTPSDETFTFNIKASADNPENGAVLPEDATATVTGSGSTKFNAITFTKAGTYTFEISEEKGDASGYTYDESVWTLTVEVIDNESKLEVQSHTYTKIDGTAKEEKAEFENIYKPTEPKTDTTTEPTNPTSPTTPTEPTTPTNPTSPTNTTITTKPTETTTKKPKKTTKKTTTTKSKKSKNAGSTKNNTTTNPPYSKTKNPTSNNNNTNGGNNGNTPNTGSEQQRNLPLAFLVTFLLGLNTVYFSFRRRKLKGRKAK